MQETFFLDTRSEDSVSTVTTISSQHTNASDQSNSSSHTNFTEQTSDSLTSSVTVQSERGKLLN